MPEGVHEAGPVAEPTAARPGMRPEIRREETLLAFDYGTQRLGVAMDGVLCDPDGNPLPLPMLEQIGVDLSGLYAALSARDFAAGSPLARRLFS